MVYEKGESFGGVSSSEVWNVAKGYSNLVVLMPILEFNKLLKVARFGTENIEFLFTSSPDEKKVARIEAMRRLLAIESDLIDSVFFKIRADRKFIKEKEGEKKATDRDIVIKMEENLDKIEDSLKELLTLNYNDIERYSDIKIDEDKFTKAIKGVKVINRTLLEVLDRARLIYPYDDEESIEDIMNRLKGGG